MLTHDVEPIIDTVKSMYKIFNNLASASFLRFSGGLIEEQPITKNDIQTFSQICNKALESDKNEIVKLIYLRRDYEISDDKGDAYQVLSNLLHKREQAIDDRELKIDGKYPEMNVDKFESGCKDIKKRLANFSYADILKIVSDTNALRVLYEACQNGYEKLQIFRFLNLGVQNSVILKFINETYHIENDFICQLDPVHFETIPEYVINECNKILQAAQ